MTTTATTTTSNGDFFRFGSLRISARALAAKRHGGGGEKIKKLNNNQSVVDHRVVYAVRDDNGKK